MKPGSQFPDLTPSNLGDRYIDPAELDRPIDPVPEPQGDPSLATIVLAAFATGVIVWSTWWGGLF